MKRKCEKMGLGFARLSRKAVESLLERARRVLVRPLAILVPPPPLNVNAHRSASTRHLARHLPCASRHIILRIET